MTPAQVDLLKRLIQNERRYWLMRLAHERNPNQNEYPENKIVRGEEVGWINGVNPRTAHSLVEMGLGEIVNERNGLPYIYLVSESVEVEFFKENGNG